MDINMKKFGIAGLQVKAIGRLDLDNAVEYGTTIKNAVDDNDINELVLDFQDITFISSFGLKVVLELFQSMKNANGSMKLVNVSEQIRNSFKMVGFDKFLVFE